MEKCQAIGIGNIAGDGGLISYNGYFDAYISRNYIENITTTGNGAIMWTNNGDIASIGLNCMSRTWTSKDKRGQLFYINNQKTEIKLEDNVEVMSPDENLPRIDINYFHFPKSVTISKNNISNCCVTGSTFYINSTGNADISLNTIVRQTTDVVYNLDTDCTITNENIVNITTYNTNPTWTGLFDIEIPRPGCSATNCIFISVTLYALVDTSESRFTLKNCIFYDCTFKSKNLATTSVTIKPYTNTNIHIYNGECEKFHFFTENDCKHPIVSLCVHGLLI